ncbi:MAG: type II CAAX endopeptidase family protein [Actinomycetaceae bacterium]|nr:type II CAAX endopeptidase family protein [Actinomycetaceae bacterium]
MTETVNPGGTATTPAFNVREYLRGGRTPHYKWWKLLLAALIFYVFWNLCQIPVYAVVLPVFGLETLTLSQGVSTGATNLMSHPGLLMLSLGNLGVAIPALALALFVVEKRGIGSLSSVKGRLRWDMIGRALLPAIVLWGGILLYEIAMGAPIVDLSTVVPQIVIILLLVPLQSAAEEYVFRGGIMQAIGAWGGPAWLALIISTALFIPVHGQYHGLGLVSVSFMGICMAWLTMRTGGLEAAIVLHTVNNYLAFGGALLFQANPMSDAETTWLSLLTQCGIVALYTAIADWWLRRVIIKREGRGVMTGAFGGPVGNFGQKAAPLVPAPVAASAPVDPSSAALGAAASVAWVPVAQNAEVSGQPGVGPEMGPGLVESVPQSGDYGMSFVDPGSISGDCGSSAC